MVKYYGEGVSLQYSLQNKAIQESSKEHLFLPHVLLILDPWV